MSEGKKSLNDYKDELHKCSKCGQCQAVCPIYQLTGNECAVSRGQFIMLDGVVRGKLSLNSTINKYLDLCLKCNKCSQYCPSGINILDILLSAKSEYFKKSRERFIYGFFESKLVFNSFLKVIGFFTGLFIRKNKSKCYDTKAVYFGGCVSRFSPGINNFVTKLLNKIKIEVVDVDFNCCGMPFLTTGNIDRFIENLEENISKIPNGIKYIITECSSCEWAWKQYFKYTKNEELKEKLSKIEFKNIYEIINENDLKFSAKSFAKLTYHIPCHEEHSGSVETIIKKINNAGYIELNGKSDCCGFSGYEHLNTIKEMLPVFKTKRQKLKETGADYLLTTCVGCLISLSLLSFGLKHKTKRVISYLKDNCSL